MITCEDFFAEFGDYLENQVSPEGPQAPPGASVPVPHLPCAVRLQLQDCKDRVREWFVRVTQECLDRIIRHDAAENRP